MAKAFGKRTYDVMELSDSKNRTTMHFQMFILTLIALNVIAVILETVEALSARYAAFFFAFEIVSVAVFTIEYLLRLWLCTYNIRSKKEDLIMVFFVVAILLTIASSLMYFIENRAQPGKFSSIPAAMWWGITTLTTVGYGDVYPITTAGKVIGSIISLLDIGIFALPAGILAIRICAGSLQDEEQRKENLQALRKRNKQAQCCN